MIKSPIKNIKKWFSFILTTLVVVVLFAVIFVQLDLAQPSASFFVELSCVLLLSLQMKLYWYSFGENKRLEEDLDLNIAKKNYYKQVDDIVKDSNDLDDFVKELNIENKKKYISNHIGSRTANKLQSKNFWILLFHPSYKNLTKEEIGTKRFEKLEYKYSRKADRIREIKSSDLVSLSETELLYDARNYTKTKKRNYQIFTTLSTMLIMVVLASIAFKEIMLNWENVFRFATYLCTMTWAAIMTIITSYKITGDELLDYLARLSGMLDKYDSYKKNKPKEVLINGNDNNDGNRLC